MANSRLRIGIAAVVVVAFGVTAVFAQSAQLAGDALLEGLLAEVRALRIALQKNSAYELRGRLLIDRARLHQEVIRELSREVEGAGDFMRPTEVDTTFESEAAMVEANIEQRAATLQDPEERRRMVEREKRMMEKRREMESRHREQMRLRLQRVEQRLQEERDKLRAVEEELAAIQAELTSP